MATLALDAVWLTYGLDPTQTVRLNATKIVDKPAAVGGSAGQRLMANGRLRSVVRAGSLRNIDLDCRLVDPTTEAKLNGWLGALLLFRDPFGRKEWGTFYDLTKTQQAFPGVVDLAFTFVKLTHDEAV